MQDIIACICQQGSQVVIILYILVNLFSIQISSILFKELLEQLIEELIHTAQHTSQSTTFKTIHNMLRYDMT